MLISDLQNRLRMLVSRRIAAGELTGTALAHRAGFQQAHVSNFLNGRRGLSIDAMDRMMAVLRLEVRDLMPAPRRVGRIAAEDAGVEAVPVVPAGLLFEGDFADGEATEFVQFKRSFLQRLRPLPASERGGWRRFVAFRADKQCALAMRPRLAAGAMLLIDRHYNSPRSYRRQEPNLYVVKSAEGCKVRYVQLQGDQLTLRPENQEFALDYIQPGRGESFADYVAGRVAHVAMEL